MSQKLLIGPIEQQSIVEAQQLAIAGWGTILRQTFPNPFNYVCIRKMFGEECNKDVLMAFVNDVLGKEGSQKVVDVEFLDLSFWDDAVGEAQLKLHPIDAICTSANGEQFIIEIGSFQRNIVSLKHLQQAVSAYAKKVYLPHMSKSGKYKKIKYIHFIAILSRSIRDETEASIFDGNPIHGPFELASEKNFLITCFEPRNYNYSKSNINEWGSFFVYIPANKHIVYDPCSKREAILEKAFRTLAIENWSLKQLRDYLKVEARHWTARYNDDQLEHTAFSQGFHRGESMAKEEIARKFLEQGLSVENIGQATGLSLEKLQALQVELDSKKSA